ncbi:hypothetical protein ACFLRF_00870 [Candidatus Altiarchaeota archaeon]
MLCSTQEERLEDRRLNMKRIGFDFTENTRISDWQMMNVAGKLGDEIDNVRMALRKGYDTRYASINLAKDDDLIRKVRVLVREKRMLKPKALIVVGIGGSNLGTKAVHESVNGRLYNDANRGMKVYFADTPDPDKIADILGIAQKILKAGDNILVNVVTKSGQTTETIAIFELFLRLLLKYKKKSCARLVVVTTDRDSPLWNMAVERGYSLLEIPSRVGGRYSVLSAVGLFPLAMTGLNIERMQDGARSMISSCTRSDVLNNPAIQSAATRYAHYRRGRNINDLFVFATDLESVGKWYRQLMGESLGKTWDKDHKKRIHAGITPTVSIGSTDLHSMAQLYLGGPKDKLTTFVKVTQDKSSLTMPDYDGFDELVGKIQGRDVKHIMDAIYEGVKRAFMKAGRPFMEVILPDKSEESIAAFLQYEMISMMYLAYLMNVDPFDQPSVELYKKETRRILADD